MVMKFIERIRHNLVVKDFILHPSSFILLLIPALVTVVIMRGAGAQDSPLPPGPGAEVAQQQCLTCHEADIIVSQRLTRAGWGRVIDKMVRWNAVVPADDRERLLTYLSTHFGDPSAQRARPAGLPPGPGAEKIRQHCLTCHEADIIIEQHLTRAQWSKELDKMARWGAVFPPEDRGPMLTYLAGRFGPEAVEEPSTRR